MTKGKVVYCRAGCWKQIRNRQTQICLYVYHKAIIKTWPGQEVTGAIHAFSAHTFTLFFLFILLFFFFFIWYEFNKRRPISIPPSLITSGTVGALWASPPPLNVPLLHFQVSSDLVWECQLSSWNPSEKLRDGETCRERSCGGGAEKDETWQVNKEIFALHCS